MRPVVIACCVVAATVAACATLDLQPSPASSNVDSSLTPVVFIPGMTGTKLVDPATGKMLWGSATQLLRPRDGGYSVALPVGYGELMKSRLRATSPILRMRLLTWSKPIYQPIVDRLTQGGYRLGRLEAPDTDDSLFFFNYDWRADNLLTVRQLDRQLEALRQAHGGEVAVDLVCQSNAAKICRYLAKYGALPLDQAEQGVQPKSRYQIRKLVLAGASNNGSIRVLELLIHGRSYIPVVGRRLLPETFFTLRPLFDDLPPERKDLFFDRQGESLPVDLFNPQMWREYGWSIFGKAETARVAKRGRSDLFGNAQERFRYLAQRLDRSQRLHRLLQIESPWFPNVDYYRLENQSVPTVDRALLTQQDGVWQTVFPEDDLIQDDPLLFELATVPGDGHATLASQRYLSGQESAAMKGTAMVEGGHFEMVVEPPGLQALTSFLQD